MHTRIENLEFAHGYLQKTVDELHSVVLEQQREILELQRQIRILAEKLQTVAAPALPEIHEKPPHY
ncbi:MAG: SlyX family protein [Desulfovibrionales bacterium]|nr:SlyX family protein [Desulfovibrionales bacterium]